MNDGNFVRCTAHLPVKNLKETLVWYRDKLGFHDAWTSGDQDGGIVRDDLHLLFGENPEHVAAINERGHRIPLMWFVQNIDEVYAEFRRRQIEIADGLREHPYGLREFAFVDINGYYIRVAEGTSI